MKKVLLFSMFIVLTAVSLARAGSEADTTFKVTKGTLCLFGRMFRGHDVVLRVSGRVLYADTPEGAISIWELPDSNQPHPPASASIIAQRAFEGLVEVMYRRLRSKCSISQLRDSLDVLVSAHREVADSVVPVDKGQYILYWRGDSHHEPVELAGGGAGPTPPSPEPTLQVARRSLSIYAKMLLHDLDRDSLTIFTRTFPNPAQPEGMSFRTDNEKRAVLAEVDRVLRGETTGLRYLTGRVGASIVRDLRARGRALRG
jgi:hypothetical protein